MIKTYRHVLRRALIASALLGTLAACAATPTTEGTGEYFDDASITTRVKGALLANDQTHVARINVETFKGIVQLSGFVTTADERGAADRVARSVKGVNDVLNDIHLR